MSEPIHYASQLKNPGHGATPAPDLNQHELIRQRLHELRDRFSVNASRMVDLGARAFGGSPVGTDKAAQTSRPQATGSIAAITSILDELEGIAALQVDAINFADRIA